MAISVPIDLPLRTDEALKEASRFADQLNKKLGTIEFVTLTRAAIDFGRAIGQALEDIITPAVEADKALQSVRQSLQLSGDFSERNVDAFVELAKEMQNISRFSDDAVLAQVRFAKQLGLTNRETEKLVRAAVQLASGSEFSLTESFQLLGQTLDGTAGRIAQKIPEFQKFSVEALRSGAAIDYVLKRFGGASQRDIETFSGSLARVRVRFEDIFENLGSAIVNNDSVVKSLQAVGDTFAIVAEAIAASNGSLKDLVTGGLQIAITGFGGLLQTVASLDSAFVKITNFFSKSRDTLVQLGASQKILDDFDRKQKEQADRKNFFDKLITAAADASGAIDRVTNSQVKLNKETKKGFDENLPKYDRLKLSMDEIKKKQDDAIARLKRMYDQEKKLFDEEFARLAELSKNPGDLIKPIKFDLDFNKFNLSAAQKTIASSLIGGVTQALQGRQGAVNVVSQIAENLGQIFLGVPGVGQLVGLLSQGKDVVRAQVKAFIEALPEIIDAIIEAVPEVIDVLIEKSPEIAEAIIRSVLKGFYKLNERFVQAAGKFAFEILKGAYDFVGKILEGAGQFIQKLIEGIKDGIGKVVDDLNPFKNIGGGGGGGGLGDIGGWIANPVANLNRGIADLVSWKSGGAGSGFQKGGGSSSGGMGAGQVVVKLQIGQRDLAQAILDLNKQGFRTS